MQLLFDFEQAQKIKEKNDEIIRLIGQEIAELTHKILKLGYSIKINVDISTRHSLCCVNLYLPKMSVSKFCYVFWHTSNPGESITITKRGRYIVGAEAKDNGFLYYYDKDYVDREVSISKKYELFSIFDDKTVKNQILDEIKRQLTVKFLIEPIAVNLKKKVKFVEE